MDARDFQSHSCFKKLHAKNLSVEKSMSENSVLLYLFTAGAPRAGIYMSMGVLSATNQNQSLKGLCRGRFLLTFVWCKRTKIKLYILN